MAHREVKKRKHKMAVKATITAASGGEAVGV